jgi:predicted nucleotidyltransferase component of viral defense system
MNNTEKHAFRLHEDVVFFQEALNFTAAQTGFSLRLIEKDYFCTVLLAHLAEAKGASLVFRGGTCLAKIHAEFYRLSEDLDFVIPMPTTASRSQRSLQVAGLKKTFARIPRDLSVFSAAEPFRGSNQSRQYAGSVGYASQMTNTEEKIKIEVGLRESLVTRAFAGSARTLLLDPVSGEAIVPKVTLPCLSIAEAFTEKFRAALTRREIAIRDFYDIDYGVTKLGIEPLDAEFVKMVAQKLAVPGNDPIDVSEERLSQLQGQLNTRLRSVLRQRDFEVFDLDRAVSTVVGMAGRISK